MHLKIEANTSGHFSDFPLMHRLFRIENPWFSGDSAITAYRQEELPARKLRALFQRKKGRTLFDLAYALGHSEVDCDASIQAWRLCMACNGVPPTAKEFRLDMEAKTSSPDYANDIPWLIRPNTPFDLQTAYSIVRTALPDRL